VSEPAGHRSERQEVGPLALPMLRIVEWGIAVWAAALVLSVALPTLHTGSRSWWPWCCGAGVALGGVGWAYLRRGRGNAADA